MEFRSDVALLPHRIPRCAAAGRPEAEHVHGTRTLRLLHERTGPVLPLGVVCGSVRRPGPLTAAPQNQAPGGGTGGEGAQGERLTAV